MAIGLHTVVGQRKLQPQVVGVVFDEVGGDIYSRLVHRFVCAKVLNFVDLLCIITHFDHVKSAF